MAKHTRRAFLKYGARVSAGAGVGALVGVGVDKLKDMYGLGLKTVGQALADLDESIKNSEKVLMAPVQGMQYLEEKRISVYDRIIGRTEEDKRRWRQEHGIETKEDRTRKEYEARREEALKQIGELKEKSATLHKEYDTLSTPNRRGFLRNLLSRGINHPVASGAAVGAAYQSIKHTPKLIKEVYTGREKDKKEDEQKKTREELAYLRGRVSEIDKLTLQIEEANQRYEGILDNLDKKYNPTARELQSAAGSERSLYPHRQGIEHRVQNHNPKGRRHLAVFLSFFFMLFSIIMQPVFTGFAISSSQPALLPWAGILFLCGLAILALELKR
ncbi:MAG: hypothetical protein AABX72_03545 [Nanoarchaeota archaeon]